MAKIMLVEDDNNLREIYEARLMAEGYEIVTARDGEEALAVAVKERPDLVISDVMMPKISGFDMLDILRSTPETKNVKVIMMTALSQVEDKERATKLGADRYLVKSQVTLEDVAKVAREVLEGTAPGAVDSTMATAGTEPIADPSATAVAAPVVSAAAADPATAIPTESSIPPVVADEPAVTEAAVPTTPPVAEPTSAPVVAPSVDPLTVPAPAATSPAPVTVPDEPTASPAADPVAGITDLTSSDPTPIVDTPAAEPAEPAAEVSEEDEEADTDVVRPAAEVWALDSPTATPTEAEPASAVPAAQVVAAEAKVESAEVQTLEDEEAAIAKQIETMIGDPAPSAEEAPAVPLPDAPAASPEAPTEAMPAPESAETTEQPAEAPAQAAPEAAPAAPATEEAPAKTSGEKVIQPINDPTKPSGPDIHELAAKEEANEAAHVGGSVISPSGDVTNPLEAPATDAPKPGGVDPNSLAL